MADTQPFGGKTKAVIAFIVGFISFQLLFHLVIKPNGVAQKSMSELQVDSLKQANDSLQNELRLYIDGCDHKEQIYEQIIYDCEHQRRFRRQKYKETLKQQSRYEQY
jgi:hypothetical protein